MQGLAQRVTAIGPELLNAEVTYGELAWNWGKDHGHLGATWPRQLWTRDGELVAWGWAHLPHQLHRTDGSVKDVTGANLTYQVHPDHAELLDEVIDWYDAVAAGLERTVTPTAVDTFAVQRWRARGYDTDPSSLGDKGAWHQYNERDLTDVAEPTLPDGYRFRTAAEIDPQAVVQAHVDVWAPSTFSVGSYENLRQTAGYRGDLHVLVEAPDGTMAAHAIMWFDPANRTAEFEPVGTHPDHRRRGLGSAVLLYGMRRVRDAGATHMTVACLGAPGYPGAKGLYYSLGFREISRDAMLLAPATA